MKYKGHVQSIKDDIAYCELIKHDESDLIKYQLQISIKAFKEEVKVGTFIICEELEDGNIEVGVVKLPKWTAGDTKQAKARAKEIMKNLNWE